ncbi:glycine N-methyltransferase [Diorhabda sublineata]|uniref:glycine N-methyltransferase n=1 Tax=Diorhabda sublineata TaxID=1163346 RepID=UPI0024E0CD3D|nr:glycine N-methyltransferase [Diorhabda sublineata]XP_056648914.1 glycine N-methyltransferase [Diorhabda sublineata]XP_056648915.1 glycine N-methyltransferase [Diorhabda sublineata]
MAESNVFTTRSLGTASEGIKDQYADGKAAKVWEIFIGDKKSRTQNYKNFLVGLLKRRGCKRILDVACGTGIDSIMLLEEGFEVVSVDASDKMLKQALKSRWNRRKESAFDKWIIEEANWVTLYDDIEDLVGNGFDAVICLGNSFAHLLDNYGDQREQLKALRNFEKCVKPGGLLLIDHRNYDDIIDTGRTASKCIYYNSPHTTDIKTSVLYVAGKPALVTLDYLIDTSLLEDEKKDYVIGDSISEFRLSYYPHRLKVFKEMLQKSFGENSEYQIFGDFKQLDEIDVPNFYIHVVQKSSSIF